MVELIDRQATRLGDHVGHELGREEVFYIY